MNTVAEILRSEFARSWHEAVAIVQAAAEQLVPGVSLPGPTDLYIDDTGTLTFGFGSESSGEPVTALARLLEDLLEGVDAPASLRELAVENARSASHATVASFSQALAFFERPNRTSDIRAVASRLSGFRPGSTSSLDQEIARLREKVAAAEPPEEKPKEKRPRQPRLTKQQQVAAVALLAIVVFGSLAVNSGVHRGLGSAVDTAEGGIQSVVSTALEQLGFSKPPSEAAATVTADPAAGGAVEKDSRTSKAPKTAGGPIDRGARTAPTGGGAAPGELRSQPRSSEDRVPPLPPVAKATAHGSPAIAERAPAASAPVLPPAASATAGADSPSPANLPAIYSHENHDVQGPVLVRPQMPREPAPGGDTGYFELLVDENGDVSQVKLISPRRKYYDRMLVSAAKAWKFRPAMLNGRPVKYRVQVPIIMVGMPGR